MLRANSQKEASTRLMKGLLDIIILQFLNDEPMHGYQIITKIRKNFGVYFGPSTIYPLLNTLEKKGYVSGTWDMSHDRPPQNLQLNLRRKKHTKLHRGIPKPDLQENRHHQPRNRLSHVHNCSKEQQPPFSQNSLIPRQGLTACPVSTNPPYPGGGL